MSKKKQNWQEIILNLPKSIWLAIFFGFLIAVFAVFDWGYVQCTISQTGCQSMEGKLVSQNSKSIFHLQNANQTLENISRNINTKTNSVHDKETEIATLQNTINNTERESVNAAFNGNNNLANTLNSNKGLLTRSLNVSNSELTLLSSQKTKAETELLDAHKNISARYSSRLLWTLLTALFFVLCVSAVIASIYIMQKSLKDDQVYYSVNVGIPILIFVIIISGIDYMSVFAPIFSLSIFNYGDLSLFSIHLFNVIGICTVIYLIAASCSILYKVEQIKYEQKKAEKPPEQAKKELDKLELNEKNISQMAIATQTDSTIALADATAELTTALADITAKKQPLEDQLKKYASPRNHLRMILYIGGAMLFVELLRINVLTDWHLYFVSSGYDQLFKNFSQSSLSVQAFFYTSLLALIYFPVAYMIPDTPDATNVTETIQKKGYLATISEFLPRLLALIIPLLAKPLVDLIKLFTNISPQ